MPDPRPSQISNSDEVLLRQVHPSQYPDGYMSSEAFKPSELDKDMLSTMRESVGAEEAYRRWTQVKKKLSVGTFGVTVEEVANQGLQALDDAVEMDEPDHASIDFSQLASKSKKKQAGRILRDAAESRGCLYRPE